MADRHSDDVGFDDIIALALARAADAGVAPSPDIKARLMARVQSSPSPTLLPAGFRFDLETGGSWQPHPIPGIRMRVLALDRERDYATLLLDVAPGTSFPPHHHDGPEECYIVS